MLRTYYNALNLKTGILGNKAKIKGNKVNYL